MARKTPFLYNRNNKDYVALEKLPAPIRYALYESLSDYSCAQLLKSYIAHKKAFGEKRAIENVIKWIRNSDASLARTHNRRDDKPEVKVLYNYSDHVVMTGIEGAY